MNISKLELLQAEWADREAKRLALHRGLMATQPLTTVRLAELCSLGEAMMAAASRKRAALARAQKA